MIAVPPCDAPQAVLNRTPLFGEEIDPIYSLTYRLQCRAESGQCRRGKHYSICERKPRRGENLKVSICVDCQRKSVLS